MSRFGDDPQAFFDGVYRQTPPWDIGGPQPALTALFDAYPAPDPILDVGCGSGDLAIALAERGHQVVGVDTVAAAIAQAQAKAAALAAEVANRLTFQVGDALQPSLFGQQFGSVVDSGFLHLFNPQQGARFVDEVAATLRPGGRYYLLAFAVEFAIPNVPRRVTSEEIETLFGEAGHWRILSVAPAEFHNRIAATPAISACIERL